MLRVILYTNTAGVSAAAGVVERRCRWGVPSDVGMVPVPVNTRPTGFWEGICSLFQCRLKDARKRRSPCTKVWSYADVVRACALAANPAQ